METNKFYNDYYTPNKILTFVSGIDVDELLILELEFMHKIKFKMFIKEEKFFGYSEKLEKIFL